MSSEAPLWLAVNSASGSYSEAALNDLRAAFGTGEMAPRRIIDCKQDTLPGEEALEAAGVARLAVFAGDGTLSDYLARLEGAGWRGAALPLPGGTQNLLCRAMFGERSGPEIAAMLAAGELQETFRNCLRCGEHTALAEILLGPGARWADVREDMREGEIGEMISKSVAITKESYGGPLVRVAEPRIGREEGYPGLHISIQDSEMAIRGYHMDNFAEWLQQGLAILKRDFRDGAYDELGMSGQVRCRSTDATGIDLMIDGERESAAGEVSIRRDRFNLKLLGLSE